MSDRPTVLVADDDGDICDLVAFRLRRMSCEAVVVNDGAEALRMATEMCPDLAILDVTMPEHDGFEVTRRLRAQRRTADLPVLLLTARSSDSDVEEAFAAGANDYVRKPFSPQELMARVRALVGTAS